MYRNSLLILLFLFVPSFLQAQLSFNENCRKSYLLISDFNFSEAQKIIDIEKSINSDNAIVYYLEDYSDFVKVFVSEDENELNSAIERFDDRISKIKASDADSPYYLFCQGEMYLRWVSVRLKFEQNIGAVWYFNKAYRLLTENQKKYPDFAPNKITLGLLHTIVGVVPDKYKWMLDVLNFNGSIKQGRKEILSGITQTSSNAEYEHFNNIAVFLLSFVDMNMLESIPEETETMYSDIFSKEEILKKPLLLFSYTDLLSKLKKNDKLLFFLQNYNIEEEEYPLYYLLFMRGSAHLNKLEYIAARKDLLQFVSEFKGRHYIKNAYQKIAWSFLLQGDYDNYHYYLSKIIDKGYCLVDGDKQAEREFEDKTIPLDFLLKARLLFDGGYYSEAIKILEQDDVACTSDTCFQEVCYRKGRVFDEDKKIKEAIYWYKKTLVFNNTFSKYFIPNAALKLGQIYEQQKKYSIAEKYYNLCLEKSDFEYEFSIHQKAKAGLNRLGD